MEKYKYISYNGKTLTVNEKSKPEQYKAITHEGIDNDWNEVVKNPRYVKWLSLCKEIPIADGHERKFKEYCFIEHTMSVYDVKANPVQIPADKVRFEEVKVEVSQYKDIEGNKLGAYEWKETAYFISNETEAETNEAELWKELIDVYDMHDMASYGYGGLINALKSKFKITRK